MIYLIDPTSISTVKPGCKVYKPTCKPEYVPLYGIDTAK